jgi:hypothetical protein
LKQTSLTDLNPQFLLEAPRTIRSPPTIVMGIPTVQRDKVKLYIETFANRKTLAKLFDRHAKKFV